MNNNYPKPTPAFIGASWGALFIGLGSYLFGLWNSNMVLNEKGYYLAVILFGLFSAVSLQKSVRDRLEGITVTNIYFSICWFSFAASIVLLVVGLWNATLELSEKGFFGIAYILGLYAAIAVQKNIRDLEFFPSEDRQDMREEAEDLTSGDVK